MNPAHSPVDRTQHSVLVVDDNASSLYAISRTLRAAGYNVIQGRGGPKARGLVEFGSAVGLDVHLPDLLGFEVCRLVREREATAALPIVCISAMYVSPADLEHGMQIGADAYMPAPIDPEALIATIDQLIGGQGRTRRH